MTDDPAIGQEPTKKIPGLPAEEAATLKDEVQEYDSGQKEARQLTRGLSQSEIEKEAAVGEHRRSEKFKDHFESLAIIGLYAVFLVFLLVGGIWFWHLLTPVSWHFLVAAQVATLQNIATGGIIASIATGHVRKRLG